VSEGGTTTVATAIVALTGILWGFYWLPVRRLADAGLSGAWGTMAMTLAAACLLSPLVFSRRNQFTRANTVAILATALGGAAFALYSIGFLYGRVAIIILLYFLTPVWSALIAHFIMGWHTPSLRIVAIAVGLAGLAVMLGADGQWPLPRGAGEWMALASGILWSVATTGIRARSDLDPVPAAFVFAVGATLAALVLAPFLEPWPSGALGGDLRAIAGLAVGTGGLWWALSTAALLWATARLEPARVGILLMTEVLVGAVSAALLAGEHLGPLEMAGGALVLCAGVLEVWPTGRGGGRDA